MSTDDKNQTKDQDIVKIEVDRSKIEREQQDAIIALEKEKETLQTQLVEKVQELQRLADEKETKTGEFDTIVSERDTLKTQLQEIAMAEFNKKKQERLDIMKNSGVPEDKITEYDEKVQTPQDLDQSEWMIHMLQTMVTDAQAQRDADDKESDGEGDDKNGDDKNGDDKDGDDTDVQTGGVPTITSENPPPSVVSKLPDTTGDKKWQFQTVREGIDAVYAGLAKGDPEAKKLHDKLWTKAMDLLKTSYSKINFAITECPVCSAGIMEGEKCPFCSFDPKVYRQTGGEFW